MNLILHLFKKNESVKEETIEQEVIEIKKDIIIPKEESKYQRLYEICKEEVPYIGIARNKILALKNTNLVGEIKANWYSMFYNIGEWYTQ